MDRIRQQRSVRRLNALAAHLSALQSSPTAAASADNVPMSPLTADDDDDASADVAAVIAAFAGGARGTRETTPEGLDVSVLPEYTPSPPHHYVRTPARVHETAFVAPSAQLIGACVVDEGANVWFGCIMRADDEPIVIGKGSNIQDGCICHVDPGNPLIVGENVTVGHGAILHGCVVEDNAMVAMGAKVLTGARIGRGSVIGAGTIVMEGQQIPPYSVCFGVPAKVTRTLKHDGPSVGKWIAGHYSELGSIFQAGPGVAYSLYKGEEE